MAYAHPMAPQHFTTDELTTWTMSALITHAKALGLTGAKRTGMTKDKLIGRIMAWQAENPMAPEAEVDEDNFGSTLVAALEALYRAIRVRHSDIPQVLIRTGSGRISANLMAWGHYERGAWSKAKGEGSIPEMMIAGERMAMGAEAVLATMLHETAHGLADVWEIKDCSRRGVYHNQEFVMIAEKLGMEWPEGACPHTTFGWSDVRLTDATVADYFLELDELQGAITLARRAGIIATDDEDTRTGGHGATRAKGGDKADSTKSRTARKLVCGCEVPRIIRASAKTIAEGALICGVCREDFTEVE